MRVRIILVSCFLLLAQFVSAAGYDFRLDVDGDIEGSVDIGDVTKLIEHLFKPELAADHTIFPSNHGGMGALFRWHQ